MPKFLPNLTMGHGACDMLGGSDQALTHDLLAGSTEFVTRPHTIKPHLKQSLNIIGRRPVKGIEGEPLTNCEECDAPLTIPNDAIQGEIVSCKDCGASYEVKKDEASGLITLKPAEKEQEDWGE